MSIRILFHLSRHHEKNVLTVDIRLFLYNLFVANFYYLYKFVVVQLALFVNLLLVERDYTFL